MELNQKEKGVIYLGGGILLLLHTLGILPLAISTLMIVLSVAFIVWGFITLDGVNQIRKLIKR